MKMKSALREMFAGKKGTYEYVKLSDEYKEAEKKAYEHIEAFLEKLNKEQKAFFDTIYEYMALKNAEYATDHFIEGFKFGVAVGFEIGEES